MGISLIAFSYELWKFSGVALHICSRQKRLTMSDMLSPTRNTLFGLCTGSCLGGACSRGRRMHFVLRTGFTVILILYTVYLNTMYNKREDSNDSGKNKRA